MITTKAPWPFKEIMEAATVNETIQAEHLKKCCAFVSIRLSTLQQEVRDFEARFRDINVFVCGVGGLVAVWIGLSVVSLFDIVEYIINKLMSVKF